MLNELVHVEARSPIVQIMDVFASTMSQSKELQISVAERQ